MVGPLWGLFQHLRQKTTIPLAIDQYTYFFKALHQIDHTSLLTEDDLLQFTKIFWLHDPGFESQYDYYFKTFLEWEKKFPNLQPKPTTPKYNKEENQISTPLKSNKKDTTTPEPAPPTPSLPPEDEDAAVEFKLVLHETEQAISDDKTESYETPHDFVLSDLAIVPFDNRNFIQRLRRKVETAELVPTDQMDIPAMINSYIQRGYIGDILYELNDASHSNVVFLVDRNESMLAFEFLENHFVRGFKQLPHCTFEYYSFNAVPAMTTDGEHYKLTAVQNDSPDMETQRHPWNQDTWFLIFSDAGALTGIVERDRIKSTISWWMYFRNISRNMYWINPVSFEQMNDCTAKRLQMTIPMSDPTDKALYQMIHSNKNAYR